jgi:response regulator RpfG family c-di-GMP phosphodiesterase
MRRILLILEEVKEMTFLENLFRKLRFDVETIKTNVGIMDKFFKFHPDLVIMTARGKKINGIDLCKKMNPKGDATKIVLAISSAAGIKPAELKSVNIVGFLESPINPMKALELAAQHLKLDITQLRESLEKQNKVSEDKNDETDTTYVKSKEKSEDGATWVKGKAPKESVFEVSGGDVKNESTKPSKYAHHKLLDIEYPKQKSLEKDNIQRMVSRIATEGEEPELDVARQEFVKALYRK